MPGERTLAPLEPTPLAGRCALVTGAARRVGAVLARRLHEAGADVAIHYRGSEHEARELAAGLEAERPGSAAVFRADLARLDEIETLVQAVVAWSGRLDVLVN